ncbi:MAG: hypothetical protein WAT70_04690, partial [Rhizobiaceae bacterium]
MDTILNMTITPILAYYKALIFLDFDANQGVRKRNGRDGSSATGIVRAAALVLCLAGLFLPGAALAGGASCA